MSESRSPGRLSRLLYSGWSVRALLLLVAIAALVLGWIENRVGPRRATARAIRQAGGTVFYDWQYQELGYGSVDYRGEPRVPRWLIDRLGPDYFGDIACVFAGGRVDDELLTAIGRLHGLRDLTINNASVSEAGLAALGRLPRLRRLNLGHTNVDDAGLAHLAGLTGLDMLNLTATQVGDAGLAHLAGMHDLVFLYLMGTRVGDDGPEHLKGLQELRILDLSLTQVTGAGLVPLKELPHLFILNLNSTRVGDDGLEHLKDMPGVRHVQVAGAAAVTRAGVDALRRSRPDLTIDSGFSTPAASPPEPPTGPPG